MRSGSAAKHEAATMMTAHCPLPIDMAHPTQCESHYDESKSRYFTIMTNQSRDISRYDEAKSHTGNVLMTKEKRQEKGLSEMLNFDERLRKTGSLAFLSHSLVFSLA